MSQHYHPNLDYILPHVYNWRLLIMLQSAAFINEFKK